MLTLPPEPSAKDPISATFVKALMRYIRANTLLNGPDYRTKRGPNGTVLYIERTKASVATSSGLPGCYQIESIEKTEGEDSTIVSVTINFANPYFMIGGKIYEGPDGFSFDLGEDDAETFVCLRIPADKEVLDASEDVTIEGYESLQELNEKMEDTAFYTVPLYHLTGTAVDCDFRNVPSSAMGEY